MNVITLRSDGRVGIDNSAPSQIFHIIAGGRLRIANGITEFSMLGTIDTDGATNASEIVYGRDYGDVNAGGNITYEAKGTAAKHIFYTTQNTTEQMRIDTNGNVGINVSAPNTYS